MAKKASREPVETTLEVDALRDSADCFLFRLARLARNGMPEEEPAGPSDAASTFTSVRGARGEGADIFSPTLYAITTED